jgi:hypothetical protein
LNKIAVAAIVLPAASFLAYDYTINGPRAAVKQAELEKEISQVAVPPGAILTASRSSHKDEAALVTRTYKSKLTYQQLRAHYDAALSRNGWQFKSENKIFDWGRDIGWQAANYCKGAFEASLGFGIDPEHIRSYSFSLALAWKMDGPFSSHATCRYDVGKG